ncbi:hypothetical protein TanjilG_09200 [Lupinus angustifolius]|uniref:Response regulatory domain-containing protein n=1 Tax=Lupinus angustifolius TaxID=3871 RepID=A0A4P1QWM7_LUPAN|nr:hypothetical protein TanjilG_09200 [Lupinus angustifolius]
MEFVDSRKLQLQQQQQHFHVLAVDDSVIDRKLLERLLRGSSCKVTCVDSGDKALKYLGLIDDLANTIESSSSPPPQPLQEEESSWKDVPVVVMSSENIPSRISMCLEEGAEEFLLKPLKLSDLKKLQPYFLKSFDNSYEQESVNSSIASENDHIVNNNNNMNNNNINSISKRKAMSPEPPERSRPKMKGLEVA